MRTYFTAHVTENNVPSPLPMMYLTVFTYQRFFFLSSRCVIFFGLYMATYIHLISTSRRLFLVVSGIAERSYRRSHHSVTRSPVLILQLALSLPRAHQRSNSVSLSVTCLTSFNAFFMGTSPAPELATTPSVHHVALSLSHDQPQTHRRLTLLTDTRPTDMGTFFNIRGCNT